MPNLTRFVREAMLLANPVERENLHPLFKHLANSSEATPVAPDLPVPSPPATPFPTEAPAFYDLTPPAPSPSSPESSPLPAGKAPSSPNP